MPNGDRRSTDDRHSADDDADEKRKSRLPLIILAIVVVIAFIAAVVYWLLTRNQESTDDAYTGGIGISVSTSLVTEHLQVRQSFLIKYLSPVDQPYNVLLQQVQQGLMDAGQSMSQAVQAAPRQVFQMLQVQSAVLAYSNVFLITAAMSLVMIPTALLMSGIKTKPGGRGH